MSSAPKWHITGYDTHSLAADNGRVLGEVRRLYRTWLACPKGEQPVEYLTEEQAKVAVERSVFGHSLAASPSTPTPEDR